MPDLNGQASSILRKADLERGWGPAFSQARSWFLAAHALGGDPQAPQEAHSQGSGHCPSFPSACYRKLSSSGESPVLSHQHHTHKLPTPVVQGFFLHQQFCHSTWAYIYSSHTTAWGSVGSHRLGARLSRAAPTPLHTPACKPRLPPVLLAGQLDIREPHDHQLGSINLPERLRELRETFRY